MNQVVITSDELEIQNSMHAFNSSMQQSPQNDGNYLFFVELASNINVQNKRYSSMFPSCPYAVCEIQASAKAFLDKYKKKYP